MFFLLLKNITTIFSTLAMNTDVKQENQALVKTILVSQPQPNDTKSPYNVLAEKYGIRIDFKQFIRIEGLAAKDFRKYKVNPVEFTAVIFTSKNAVTHFFRLCDEMRIKMSPEVKYFCSTEAIANYLQKYIFFRKRKVFFAKTERKNALQELLKKHRKGEKFILPCTVNRIDDLPDYLKNNNFQFAEAPVYETVFADFSDMEGKLDYDMLVFFTPMGIQSLFHNFPDFQQNATRIAVLGTAVQQAAEQFQLRLDVQAPTPEHPSITAAIEHYLQSIGQKPVAGNTSVIE